MGNKLTFNVESLTINGEHACAYDNEIQVAKLSFKFKINV